MKLAHFVITRFCLRGRRLHGGVDGPWFGSVDPLKARTVDLRLKLLETTCLPGLASQTSQEFTWVLLVDARLREDFKERLRNLARARDRVCLHEHRPDAPDRLETLGWLAPLLADRPEYVLTTLNDDDVLPRRFVEVVQSHVFDLGERGRAPLFKFMGARRVATWDMVFTPDAPLGEAIRARFRRTVEGRRLRRPDRQGGRFPGRARDREDADPPPCPERAARR